jgi:hypothetical protein
MIDSIPANLIGKGITDSDFKNLQVGDRIKVTYRKLGDGHTFFDPPALGSPVGSFDLVEAEILGKTSVADYPTYTCHTKHGTFLLRTKDTIVEKVTSAGSDLTVEGQKRKRIVEKLVQESVITAELAQQVLQGSTKEFFECVDAFVASERHFIKEKFPQANSAWAASVPLYAKDACAFFTYLDRIDVAREFEKLIAENISLLSRKKQDFCTQYQQDLRKVFQTNLSARFGKSETMIEKRDVAYDLLVMAKDHDLWINPLDTKIIDDNRALFTNVSRTGDFISVQKEGTFFKVRLNEAVPVGHVFRHSGYLTHSDITLKPNQLFKYEKGNIVVSPIFAQLKDDYIASKYKTEHHTPMKIDGPNPEQLAASSNFAAKRDNLLKVANDSFWNEVFEKYSSALSDTSKKVDYSLMPGIETNIETFVKSPIGTTLERIKIAEESLLQELTDQNRVDKSKLDVQRIGAIINGLNKLVMMRNDLDKKDEPVRIKEETKAVYAKEDKAVETQTSPAKVEEVVAAKAPAEAAKLTDVMVQTTTGSNGDWFTVKIPASLVTVSSDSSSTEKSDMSEKILSKPAPKTFVQDITDTAHAAKWRIGQRQALKRIKDGLLLLCRNNGSNRAELQLAEKFLNSKIGEGLISALIGFGVSRIPMINDNPKISRLMEEFKIEGAAIIGDDIVERTISLFLPILNDTLSAGLEAIPDVRIEMKEKPKRVRVAAPKKVIKTVKPVESDEEDEDEEAGATKTARA